MISQADLSSITNWLTADQSTIIKPSVIGLGMPS
jgi:hypothetical protein